MAKSGIMYIIAKSERRSEIWPHCGLVKRFRWWAPTQTWAVC